MAASGASSVKVQRCSRGFRTVLASAVLEWLLIFLLFIDAIFSYLVTKFSRYCKLQIPCLLCSRLDHVIGDEKPGFYRNLICGAHKLEISSLVLCHSHDKLADVHGMCEICLFSFATQNKSNAETYRLLVGKLGMGPEHSVDEDPLLNDPTPDSFRTRPCSCCNNPWTMRSAASRFLHTKLIAPELGELNVPSLGPQENGKFPYQGGMQKRRDKPSGLLRASHQASRSIDPLSYIGYTELKITSDTESEVPLSDEDDASALDCEPDDLNEDLISQYVQLETHPSSPEILPKNMTDDLTLEKMIHETSTSEHSVLIPHIQLEVDKPHGVTSSATDVAIGHGLEELNWHQVEQRVNPSVPCELISLDDIPASTCVKEAPVEVLGDNLEDMGTSDTGHTITECGEVCKPESVSTMTFGLELKTGEVSKAMGAPVEVLVDNLEAMGTSDTGHTSFTESGEVCKPGNGSTMTSGLELTTGEVSSATGAPVEILVDNLEAMGTSDTGHTSFTESGEVCNPGGGSTMTFGLELKTGQVSSDYGPLLPNSLSDAYKLAVGNKGSQASAQLAEQLSGMDSARVSEDLKLFLSQLSSARGLELSVNDMSPKVHGNGDELKISDSSSSGVQKLQRKISLERNESGMDSARVSEDLKLLLSQQSSARGLELSVNDMSPKVHGNGDELKISDSSSSGVQILQRKISLERNESGFESLDGSIVSEIEGESVVDRLKRQVEYDRKSMSALYKELEEERNAASIAANQALAMITRLQEEKAALHMEALQYLRMMEEQAEYDVEALQKANDLLAEREKEIQDLEAELEFYREKFSDESMLEKVQEATSDMRGVDMRVEHSEPSGIETDANIPCYSPTTKESESNDKPEGTNDLNISKKSVLDLEDERLYISQCLKKLEKRLHLFSDNWVYVDLSNGVYSGRDTQEVHDLEETRQNELGQETNDLVDGKFSVQKSALLPKGNSPAEETVGNSLSDDKENDHVTCDRAGSTMDGGVYGLESVGSEVSDLNERLAALEADKNFLEHAINYLGNGDEGLKFIREIAQHLCELRKIGIRRREQVIA
ncbi:myosin-binding protein 1-like [Macadamia integrifolia]|uniref:myosin-binding protein 1-like n=1 Tax=Macadamia integrifolia TaxID=60698 RepID=UPI001C5000A9|nr:myosin-binding protein 1-like [Macadamia integrifolia]